MKADATRHAGTCFAVDLGRIEYSRALDLQREICSLKKQGFEADVLLLLEHPPTITLGRNGRRENLIASGEELAARKVEVFETDRGGDITFHGPGQIVGYPLLALDRRERDVHRYMRNLEATIIDLLADYGVEAERQEKLTGVWTSAGKVCAMGVHISRWITRHGFALNVNTDLSFFDLIVPCGLKGKTVASMASLLSRPVPIPEVNRRIVSHFGRIFERRMMPLAPAELREALNEAARDCGSAFCEEKIPNPTVTGADARTPGGSSL